MYNIAQILSNFEGLVKFRKEFGQASLIPSGMYGASTSGRYFNEGVDPAVTLDNIYALMPNVDEWTIPDYSAGSTYDLDDIVTDSSKYYISLANDNTGKNLDNADYWKETTLQGAWMQRKINASIQNVLANVIQAKSLIDHSLLYAVSDTHDVVNNESKYVGFEIRVLNSEHLKAVINRIATQFTEANTGLTLYLRNQNTLVATITIDADTAKEVTWTNITDQELSAQGRYFLYYDQDEIGGSACNWDFYTGMKKTQRFVEVLPFEVANTTTDFISNVQGYTSNSYGLGLDLSVRTDLTDFFINNQFAFAETIQLQFGYDIIKMITRNSNIRANREQMYLQSIDQGVLTNQELSESEHSLASKLKKSYGKLKAGLKFGDAALPCDENAPVINTNFG